MVIRNIGFGRKMGDPKYRIWPVRGLTLTILKYCCQILKSIFGPRTETAAVTQNKLILPFIKLASLFSHITVQLIL